MYLIIATLFAAIGCASIFLAARARSRGMQAAPYYAVTALAFALASVLTALNGGWDFNAYLQAAVSATNAYLWWHNGGGDGTKLRLKSWAGRFQGVRRTAPSHS